MISRLLLCAFCVTIYHFSFAAVKQEVTFKNVSAKTQVYNEVNCLAVKFDAVLKYSYNQLRQQGDSATDQYIVEAYLKNEKFINATKGYGTYQNPEGHVRNSYKLLLSNDVKYFGNITLFIPLAAIDVGPDSQRLQPVFRLLDKRGNVIADNIAADTFAVKMPPKLNLHLNIQEIVVSETDFKNEDWDYFFAADTNKAKPEVCWSVLLAQRKINGSPPTNNNCCYRDAEGHDDVEFTISKDDIFYINVYDFDMQSFSDLIGSMRVDMNDMKQFSGSSFTSKFGKVLKMDFVVTIL
jgi:hypothetical protein